LYNAQILAASFDPRSPSQSVYTVNWQPIPNWAGPLALAGLVGAFSPWAADRVMTTVTLAGFAAAILWLRVRVAGARGVHAAALLAAVLAMNMPWLFGFTSFLIGAFLFPITLAIWWTWRDDLTALRILMLAGLLSLGYFCHVVSLGLTALGLAVLALTGPLPDGLESAWRSRVSRAARTSLSFIPLMALGLLYLRIARQGGRMRWVWDNLADPWSPRAWMARLGGVDPLTLALKDGLPLTERDGPEFSLLAPAGWLAVALALWWFGRIWGRPRSAEPVLPATGTDRRGWLILAALLCVSGLAGPDSLGPTRLMVSTCRSASCCSAWSRSSQFSTSASRLGRGAAFSWRS
jgi:hypothetical protein